MESLFIYYFGLFILSQIVQQLRGLNLIFATQTRKPIYPRSLTTELNKAIKIATVPKIRFHDVILDILTQLFVW